MASSAEFDPIVVDVAAPAATITMLFERRSESAKLDYKREYDPTNQKHKVEVARDIVGMANTAGGFLLVGVEDDGTPCGLLDGQLDALDESVLRQQVGSYIGVSLPLFIRKDVERDGKRFALITVLRSQHVPVVMERDGQYPLGDPKKTPFVAFKTGDVFVRHGSSTERWNQADVAYIYARVIEREREKWLAGFVPDATRILREAAAGVGLTGSVVRSPAARDLLRTDASTFEQIASAIARGLMK
jgi:hypothetical protein